MLYPLLPQLPLVAFAANAIMAMRAFSPTFNDKRG